MMLYTKKQAPGIWCLWGHRPVEVSREGKEPEIIVANRGADGEPLCGCIADRCSQWEWHDNAAHGENRRGFCARKTKPGAVINAQPQGGGMRIPDLKRN